jgi:hypothetical protein
VNGVGLSDLCDACLSKAVIRFRSPDHDYIRFACLHHEDRVRCLVNCDVLPFQVEFTYQPAGFIDGVENRFALALRPMREA